MDVTCEAGSDAVVVTHGGGERDIASKSCTPARTTPVTDAARFAESGFGWFAVRNIAEDTAAVWKDVRVKKAPRRWPVPSSARLPLAWQRLRTSGSMMPPERAATDGIAGAINASCSSAPHLLVPMPRTRRTRIGTGALDPRRWQATQRRMTAPRAPRVCTRQGIKRRRNTEKHRKMLEPQRCLTRARSGSVHRIELRTACTSDVCDKRTVCSGCRGCCEGGPVRAREGGARIR